MVYLAGDNNLDAAALADLDEMKKVGSTEELDLVAQVDRWGGGHVTKRYHLRKGSALDDDSVQDLGETNMGDPGVLEDFLRWGMKSYPAEKNLVILWNHGSGWDDADIYRTARREMGVSISRRGHVVAPGSNGGDKAISVRRVRTVGSKPFRRALFRSTITSAIGPGARPRAIAFDDTSKDFLDNIETKKVLSAVTKDLGRKIDILGMDACLMSMAEVLYQIRDSVLVTVGSEEVEPSDGWPYDVILKALAAKPEMTPQQLAVLIVEKYLLSYAADSNVTQAACDLTKCGELADVLDRLAKALIPAFSVPKSRGAIFESRDQVQEYEVKEYVDLYNFCDLLAAKVPGSPLAKACQGVMETVREPGFVLGSGYKGTAMQHSYGVAVYFPRKVISPLYATLDFTGDIGWGQFLKKYSGEQRQPDRARVAPLGAGRAPRRGARA
jgi:Clostripain family